ncbi:MAG TPA: thioredoxin domain-containing protein, partial [Saprospiraceae bacterium]|nr:thioredoxin domain-containing protein [Saprospiraceae bacterium]
MNRLQHELSPYLSQHRNNPVNWYPWSEEVLQEARQQNKPILVSIGYSTCHWCHVMAHESFEDPHTAELMNQHFINVKIDREERPDLDHYFMDAVQAMGISGGWPLNCFLTPEGQPFFGGTYFPPQPKYGRPSWSQVLMSIHQAYQTRPGDILDQAAQLANHLEAVQQPASQSDDAGGNGAPVAYVNGFSAMMDRTHGGFGNQPKFPNAQALQSLTALYYYTGDPETIHHVLFSLRHLALGGIFDQLDGGFCRYSVDAEWNVPHFEKMLYDHAQILQAMALAWPYRRSPFLKSAALRSLSFFEKEMQDDSGLFYAAMDADSEGEEGSYYVWTREELQDILGDRFKLFAETFEWSGLDLHHPEKKVLRLKRTTQTDEELMRALAELEPELQGLSARRSKRIKPSIDRKMITGWNAMTVSAYVGWYQALGDPAMLENALHLLDRIRSLCSGPDLHLCRYYMEGESRGHGFLEDYAYYLKALLDVYEATGTKSLLEEAVSYFRYLIENFKSENSPFFTLASARHSDFPVRQTDWQESSYPNPNALFCGISQRLEAHTGDLNYGAIRQPMLDAVRSLSLRHPVSMAGWALALWSE